MIDFRYHLVSTVAIFLALTVGIVLGSTMLQDPLLHTLKEETEQLRLQSERLRADKDVADQFNTGAAQLIAAYETVMLDRRLTDVRIVVVEPDGVDPTLRDAVVEQLRHAGGTVVGRITLTERYLDPAEATHVAKVADRWAEGLNVSYDNPYEQAGAELAQALLAFEDDQRADTGFDPDSVLAGYVTSGLLAVHGKPAGRADAALLLAPAEPFAFADERDAEDPAATPPANAIMLAFARALDQVGIATVLAGPPDAADPHGVIGQARTEKARFTTVDIAGTAPGDVVTVLALATAVEGRHGHYGIGAQADGFLPEVLPTPRPEPTPTPSGALSAVDDEP